MDDRPSTSGAAGAVSETPKSSGASAADQAERKQRQKVKKQVCTEVTRRLESLGHPYTLTPNYAEDLLAHFNRLPTRYALDVNTERAEDVLNHKRLLEEAKRAGPHGVPVFFVRPVRLAPAAPHAMSAMETDGPLQSMAAPPAFGSTQNLQEEMGGGADAGGMEEDVDGATMQRRNSNFSSNYNSVPMHEVTFSTMDRPKLLSQLSAVLADVGLNIREAHVFSTSDGLSLDVFVVDGWPHEEVMELHSALLNAIQTAAMTQGAFVFAHDPSAAAIDAAATSMNEGVQPGTPMAMHAVSSGGGSGQLVAAVGQAMDAVRIPSDGRDDWEIDSSQLKLSHKIASGSFGDLFRGTYCGQDVAIKILKPERLNDTLQQEFAQEVFIMRKVRHKNVVQFIGACTKPPNLSIVTEFMAGGSVYDYLHKHKGSMKPPMLLRVALDVAKGMDFLHKNHIIHRDLKAANLLLDENEVVKVADFGVARVKADSGIMTAETGTYRWMAPEVIEHRAYDHKADVFSFSITLWELLTGKIPYSDLTPLQAAVSVVQKGLRPPIPKGTHPKLVELMDKCWHTDPAQRPEFAQIIPMLTEIAQEVEEDSGSGKGGDSRRRERRGGFFAALKR